MSLKDSFCECKNGLCDCPPFGSPKTREQVDHNWNKLKEIHDALCCLLNVDETITEITQNADLSFSYTNENGDTVTIDLVGDIEALPLDCNNLS